MKGNKFSDEVRIGACADYLVGVPMKEIVHKWGVSGCWVSYKVRKAGFKLRKPRPSNKEINDADRDPRT